MSTNAINVFSQSILAEIQQIPASLIPTDLESRLLKQTSHLARLLTSEQMPQVPSSTMDELVKLSVTLSRGDFLGTAEILWNLVREEPESLVGSDPLETTSTAVSGNVNRSESTSQNSISMSDLLALMAEIIESSQQLRSQIMQNRIIEAVATSDLAISLAADKCKDAQTKFGITLAASIVTLGVSTFATVRMAQPKTLQDKHVRSMSGDETATVKSLDARSLNDYTARLQDARTGKYRGVSQGAEMASGVVGNVNEIQHAAQIRAQEETQATKDMKEKFDAQLDQYIQNLTQGAGKLNEILDSIAKASLVTNR